MASKVKLTSVATSGLAIACLAANSATAQTLDEIVVTAQKREQSLQEVPISLEVLSREFLDIHQIQNINDLQNTVPNLYISTNSGSQVTTPIYIRGLGQLDTQITLDPSVALYLDGVYIGSAAGAAMDAVDIERIEVLRGPQGTLYGRNATGGAVNLVGRRANTEEFELQQRFGFGNLGVFNSLTRINLPVSDRFAVKLNYFQTEREDGLVKNKTPGARDLGEIDNESFMVDVRWRASDSVTLDYRYEWMDGKSTQILQQLMGLNALAATAFPFVIYSDVSTDRDGSVTTNTPIPQMTLDIDAHSLNLDWEINESLTFKSITAYRELDALNTSSLLATAWTVDFPPFNGAPAFDVDSPTYFEQFTQEFQLLGSGSQLEWVVGAFYYEDESWVDESTVTFGIVPSFARTEAEAESWAAFGQATWTPAAMDERWHITFGGRYSQDQRKATRDSTAFYGTFDEDFDNFSPSVSVRFDLNGDSSVYATYSEGFRSGGTSQRSGSAALFAAGFDTEEITNYEGGFKGRFADRRAEFNAALFYMEMKGLQSSVQTDPTGPQFRDFVSVDKVELGGFEADLRLAVTDNLTTSVSYGYLDTKVGPNSLVSPGGATYFLTNEMPFAPENMVTAALDYRTELPLGSLHFNLNYSFMDTIDSAIILPDNVSTDSYSLWGSALTWSDIKFGDMSGTLSVSLWGRNLTDESYLIASNTAFGGLGVSQVGTWGAPRNYGVTVTYDY